MSESILDVVNEVEKDQFIQKLNENEINVDETPETILREYYFTYFVIEDNPITNIIYNTISDYVSTHGLPQSINESMSVIRSLSDLIGQKLNEEVDEDLVLGLGHFQIILYEDSLAPRPKNLYSTLIMCNIEKAQQYDDDELIEQLNNHHYFIDKDQMLQFEYINTESIRDVQSKQEKQNSLVKISKVEHNPKIYF